MHMLKNVTPKKLTFIDLFAGCGGLSEGFLMSGEFEGLAHVEWEIPMVDTLRKRLADHWGHNKEEAEKRVIHFDIQKTSELLNGKWKKNTLLQYGKTNHPETAERGLKSLVGKRKVDLIIGGPPCQAYSIAGRAQDENSMKNDYRNYLFESFIGVVNEFKPKAFVFENVPGLLSAKPGDIPVTQRIFDAFKKAGYQIREPKHLKKSVYSADEFGVPQKRRRIIIIGVRENSGINLEELYSKIDSQRNLSEKLTVRDAIANLPKLNPLESKVRKNGKNVSHRQIRGKKVPFHVPRFHNSRDIEFFRTWIEDGMNRKSSEEKIAFYNDRMNKSAKHAKYRNLEWDKPSPTIVAHLYKDGLMFIHPDSKQARSITVREAALLQSFPEDYVFTGSNGAAYKMIGNAVPPLLAEKIAVSLSESVKTKNSAVKKTQDTALVSDIINEVQLPTLTVKKPMSVGSKNKIVKKLKILVACEESQAVTKELRELGHDAYSCDLLPSSGGHPEWHFNCDVFKVIEKKGGKLENGKRLTSKKPWDMMIAHPPCTYLAVSGAQWYYHPEDKHLPGEMRRPHPKYPNRADDREDGVNFFIRLWNADIPRIAIENPIGIMSSRLCKPSQIVQPFHFGDEARKTTCFWLKNLPPLEHTDVVGEGERVVFKSGKSQPKWYSDAFSKSKSDEERRTMRSKTFPGMARQVALQWTNELNFKTVSQHDFVLKEELKISA